MRKSRRWLALIAAGLGVAQAGCQTWVGGMTLPSPRYLEHYPQYFPPDPAFPLPRELASQEDPDGRVRGAGIPNIGPAPVPPGPLPVSPVAEPIGVVVVPAPGPVPVCGGWPTRTMT